MTDEHPNAPLHSVTLETILTRLVAQYGWKELSQRIQIRCFYNEPSIKSSLKFFAPHAVGPERSGRFVSEFSQEEGMSSPDKLKYGSPAFGGKSPRFGVHVP